MSAAPRSDVVSHAAWGARRGAARATTWWGKAWVRAVEEAAYDEGDLRAGRRLSRQAAVGGISVGRGRVVAAVADAQGLWSVEVVLGCFDAAATSALVEVVAAEAGRIGALLARDLPHALVEHADEAGAELLPFGGELGCSCTCQAWVDPCPHALAVLYQCAWLLDAEPLLLLHLRGLAREELLAQLHARAPRREISTIRDADEA
ncbi:MAG: SWIM zinc finger family protein, partial [Nocardioides sp.]